MSAADGFRGEMRIDHEFERALAGTGTPSALTALVDDLRPLVETAVSEPVARRHAAAAAAAVRESVPRGAVVVPLRADRARVGRGAFARTAMATAAGVALVLALASAGFLPTPVQAAVAGIAERIGLHLPDPDRPAGGEQPADRTPAPADEPGSGTDDEPGATAVPPAAPPPVAPSPPPAVVPDPPSGPPAGAPSARPEPASPPASGAPETPSGPPAGTPSGPPEGTPAPLGSDPGP